MSFFVSYYSPSTPCLSHADATSPSCAAPRRSPSAPTTRQEDEEEDERRSWTVQLIPTVSQTVAAIEGIDGECAALPYAASYRSTVEMEVGHFNFRTG